MLGVTGLQYYCHASLLSLVVVFQMQWLYDIQ
jgi:hypothetical protein